jgi:hypothetical protein
MIRKFQDDFLEMVEEDAQSEEVYRLAIQLFPLTKLNNKTKNKVIIIFELNFHGGEE